MKNFINKIVRNKPDNLSKQEYWEKWNYSELMTDLHKAEKMLSEFKGGYSGEFLSAEEFHRALVDKINDIELGNQIDLNDLWIWFAPTCAWDDFVGKDGLDLGNRIFERVNNWKKNN